jgi:hypothetical protein
MPGLWIASFVAAIGGAIGVNYIRPITHDENINGQIVRRTSNPTSRIISFGALVGGLGLCASPLFAMAQVINPQILPSALLVKFQF